MKLLIALLVIWVLLSVLGFVVKGLLWLAVIGIVLFAATVVYGAVRGRAGRQSAP